MRLATLTAAALFAASTALHAQAPQTPPATKAEKHEKMKAARDKARQACESKKGEEHAACMRRETCAQAADPAACEARAKEGMARRDKAREACKDKTGDAYKTCMREQAGRK